MSRSSPTGRTVERRQAQRALELAAGPPTTAGAPAAAEQQRRHEEGDAIHQAGLEEGGVHLAAALDEHRAHLEREERARERGDVHAAVARLHSEHAWRPRRSSARHAASAALPRRPRSARAAGVPRRSGARSAAGARRCRARRGSGSRGHGSAQPHVERGIVARARCRCRPRSASAPLRSRCASSRAASPVIHRDAPWRSAILPSSVIAAFSVTCGRRSRIAVRNDAVLRARVRRDGRRARPRCRPRAAAAAPPPATRGLGSPTRDHDPAHARRDDRGRAGRRPAVMVAGLERHVERGAARARARRGAAPRPRRAARPPARGRPRPRRAPPRDHDARRPSGSAR